MASRDSPQGSPSCCIFARQRLGPQGGYLQSNTPKSIVFIYSILEKELWNFDRNLKLTSALFAVDFPVHRRDCCASLLQRCPNQGEGSKGTDIYRSSIASQQRFSLVSDKATPVKSDQVHRLACAANRWPSSKGGNDGTEDKTERASRDHVFRIPRCNRVWRNLNA